MQRVIVVVTHGLDASSLYTILIWEAGSSWILVRLCVLCVFYAFHIGIKSPISLWLSLLYAFWEMSSSKQQRKMWTWMTCWQRIQRWSDCWYFRIGALSSRFLSHLIRPFCEIVFPFFFRTSLKLRVPTMEKSTRILSLLTRRTFIVTL